MCSMTTSLAITRDGGARRDQLFDIAGAVARFLQNRAHARAPRVSTKGSRRGDDFKIPSPSNWMRTSDAIVALRTGDNCAGRVKGCLQVLPTVAWPDESHHRRAQHQGIEKS